MSKLSCASSAADCAALILPCKFANVPPCAVTLLISVIALVRFDCAVSPLACASSIAPTRLGNTVLFKSSKSFLV